MTLDPENYITSHVPDSSQLELLLLLPSELTLLSAT